MSRDIALRIDWLIAVMGSSQEAKARADLAAEMAATL